MKKLLSILLVVAMAFSIVSCGKSETKEQQSSSSQTSENNIKEKYKGKQVVLYGRFMEADAKWLADTVWSDFEDEYGVEVIFKPFDNAADLGNMLELDKGNNMPTVFVTNDSILPELVDADLVAPVSEYDTDGSYSSLFTDSSIESFKTDGVQYLTPWSEASYMTLYMKEPVEDAVANWSSMKDEISASLKEYNGYGLPDNYNLEEDVNSWDYYDLVVAGYYWAHTEYYGSTSPRIAHRSMKYDATVTELASKVYQLNGNQDDVLAMNTDPVVDMFTWENYFANEGIYIPEMWLEGWGGGTIYQAMADGACFLAFMHVNDAFTIHGLDTPASPGYLAEPDQMGVAVSPQGCALDIVDGKPAYTGTTSSVKWSWGWGITPDSPDKELSFELIKWIMTGKDDYVSHWESTGQGTPLKDFVANPNKYLTNDWMVDVYNIGSQQVPVSMTAPLVPQFSEVGTVYLDAWYDIVVGKNNSDISGTLKDVYAPKAADFLK